MSTCLLTIGGKMDMSFERFSRPKYDMVSYRPILINTLARHFTPYLSECMIPKQWKTSKTVLLYKKEDSHDIRNYPPIRLPFVTYMLFMGVIFTGLRKVLNKGQPCIQAGFLKGFNTTGNIRTVWKLIEVSQEYKVSLFLTFIDLKKAFDSVEVEAVLEALGNQGVPTQYVKVCGNFRIRISPFYRNIIIDVKRRVRQDGTISPKISTNTFKNAMLKLEWDDIGVKMIDLHYLRFVVLVTASVSQAELMLNEFDETYGCIGL
ncbi:hypothetical protein RB195_024793 [Necator americanus]|uniref:Reverse transcriptase domain-containing protein n=1 Tax=Necator americanus TaxID=51031 RepID=A0ABR1EPK8_NECAM